MGPEFGYKEMGTLKNQDLSKNPSFKVKSNNGKPLFGI